MNKRKTKGFTLIELMVGAALFVMVSILAFNFLKDSMTASEENRIMMDLQKQAKTAMDALQNELTNSAYLPSLGQSDVNVPASVLYPTWSTQAVANRFVFVELRDDVAGTNTPDASNPRNYIYVEYGVMDANDKKILYRFRYCDGQVPGTSDSTCANVTSSTTPYYNNAFLGLSTLGSTWTFNMGSLPTQVTIYNNYNNVPNRFTVLVEMSNYADDTLDDTLQLTVSHPSPLSSADSVTQSKLVQKLNLSSATDYDPRFLAIKLTLKKKFSRKVLGGSKIAEKQFELNTQVRVSNPYI